MTSTNSKYPYLVNLESYIGYTIAIRLDENKRYIGILDWCSNSCICISDANTQLLQLIPIQGKVIVDVNRIRYGSIYCSANGESKNISFMK